MGNNNKMETYIMNKLLLGIVATIALTTGPAHAAVSYIFNNTTAHMIIFNTDGEDSVALCSAGKAVRPDAQQIKLASLDSNGNPVYTLCD